VDVRTLPFIRFDENEAHCMRRHSLNLGGLSAELKGGVGGIGPDTRHPFVIRDFKVWNAHWALHPMTPSLMIDGLDVHHAEYALWRANYDGHAYRHVHLDDIAVNPDFMPQKGQQPVEADFPKPLEPVDDLPPSTVVTRVSQIGGEWVARGTTVDNGGVKRVLVNGRQAKAVRENFAEWEAELGAMPEASVTAFAEDAAGNVEPRPHVVPMREEARSEGTP
jgi:hypothetical protein